METGIPEAHHRTPVFLKDLRRTDPLHRSPGRGKKEACLIDWEERSQLHPHVLIVVGEVHKQKELKLKQEGVNKNPVRLASTQKVRTVKEVTGNLNQEGRNQTPMKTISISLGHDKSFRENYLQQTKHIKDPVEIHHIKQRDGESTKDFMERYKAEVLDVEGAPECSESSVQQRNNLTLELNSRNDEPKAPKKGEASGKDKPLTILMIQPWERVAKPRITQSFSPETAMSFPPLSEEDGTENPMIHQTPQGDKGSNGSGHHSPYRIQRETIWPLGGTVTLQSSRVIPMECAMISGPSIQPPTAKKVLEEKINIAIHPEYPEQTVAIGSTLTEKGRKELCSLLKQNLDIFAWKPADMTGVPRNIAEHRLNIREGYSPVRQKKRGQAPERNKAIQEEVEKLVDAGIMKEVHYHSWLSNPVMVKKHDGTWRMCVDFKDLNNACPKDCYPLPEIDWKVESLCGYSFKCFLDAYKGYHQIKMAKEDEEKTAFITSQGIFCYSKMPFGLKKCRIHISTWRYMSMTWL
ncbi:hypothetical protein Tco_0441619 [Tanacetum coccineum]